MLVLGPGKRHSLGGNTADVSRFTPLRCTVTVPLKKLLTRVDAPYVLYCGDKFKNKANPSWAHVDVGTGNKKPPQKRSTDIQRYLI